MLGNGTAPQPLLVGEITIKILDNGQIGVNVAGTVGQLDIFGVFGAAQQLLAQQYKQQAAQQIQAAPPGLINRLIQG